MTPETWPGSMGMPVDVISAICDEGLLLGMETADGVWVYPAWQFAGSKVNPDMLPALRLLREAPRWSVGVWFSLANDDLAGLSPLEWLREGNSPESMTDSAVHAAHEWAT